MQRDLFEQYQAAGRKVDTSTRNRECLTVMGQEQELKVVAAAYEEFQGIHGSQMTRQAEQA